MGPGFKRLNDLTILMLTHGFAVHLKEFYKRDNIQVAIGYDGRHKSQKLVYSSAVFHNFLTKFFGALNFV